MKRLISFPLIAACLSVHPLCAGGITGHSGPIPVDTTGGAKFISGGFSLSYDPSYSDREAQPASYVVLKKVVGIGTGLLTTSTVARCEAGASGDHAFPIQTSDPRRVRFLHAAYDADGVQIGDVLEADISLPFATASSDADGTFVDGRADPLQMCATGASESGTAVTLPFAFDSEWVTNGVPASFRLTQVRDSLSKSMKLLSSTTNVLVESAMPGDGDYTYTLDPKRAGRYTFFCTFLDGAGGVIGETYSASYYLKQKYGIRFVIR